MLIRAGNSSVEQEDFERLTEQRSEAAKAEGRHAHLVGQVTDFARQTGKGMELSKFAKKLKLVNPDVVIEPNPSQPDYAAVYLLLPNGKKEYLMACDNHWMPEWSVMGTTKARVPDGAGQWKWVAIPHREIMRGWRTVLLRLIQKGLIALEAVERIFGAGDRESWKILTGKGRGTLPI